MDTPSAQRPQLKGACVLDIETTTTVHLGRKASPFTPDNWTVAAAYQMQPGGKIEGSYWGADPQGARGWLKQILEKQRPRTLVGFNVGFDIQHLIRDPIDYSAYQDWIVEGGQLWDCQLVEYLLDGMTPESHMLSLNEVAIRYGGTLKIDEVKAMWEQGINTHNIPKQLLMDYLCGRGDDRGDIGNTQLAYDGQVKAAVKAKQLRSIMLNNGALVAVIEMQRNGECVDVAHGRAKAAELEVEKKGLLLRLRDQIPQDMPFEFNWGSRKQLSALIFGGKIKYKQRVHQLDDLGNPAYALKKETQYILTEGTTIAAPGDDPRIPDTAYVRYLSGKQAGQPKTRQVNVYDYDKPKIKWEDFLWPLPGFTAPRPEWEGAEPGVYSTSGEVIELLAGRGIPFLDDYDTLNDLMKDLGTYYISEELDDDGNVVKAKGMLTLVGSDGIVHGNIGMVGTKTGRFNHSLPNLGNLPRSDTSDVKQMFVSRFGEDGLRISSDFSALEVYCQANITKDTQLVTDLIAGLDMHCARLSTVEKKAYADVLLWAKGDDTHEAIKEWVVKRKNIKVFSFQRAYGAGAPKIAKGLKVPVEDVEKWMEADDLRYPGIPVFNQKVADYLDSRSEQTARFERHPDAKANVMLKRAYLQTWDGKRYAFNQSLTPKFIYRKRGVLASFKPTEVKNYPMQGMGGEWMKAAMWLAVRAFYRSKNFDGLALLTLTVHDALYIDAHKTVARRAATLVHACMLASSDFMEYWFDHEIEVPVPSETTWGASMFEEHKFDNPAEFHESAERVRGWLRKTYMQGFTPSYIQENNG